MSFRCLAAGQFEAVEAKVFGRRLVGRTAEKFGEALDTVDIGLGQRRLRRKAADGHVVDQALPQRADGLRAHWGLLSWWLKAWTRSFSRQEIFRRHKPLGLVDDVVQPGCAQPEAKRTPGCRSQRRHWVEVFVARANRGSRTVAPVFVVAGVALLALAANPSVSWSKERRSYGRTEMPLTAATAHDVILIAPGLTDDSTIYRIYLQNIDSVDAEKHEALRIPGEYLRREKSSGWYTRSVLSGDAYLIQITSGDCIVKAPYFFASESTGEAADIVIARSAYPDPAQVLGSPPRTILDRLGIRKNKNGKWRAKFLSEEILDNYYCLGAQIRDAVDEYERSARVHKAATGTPDSTKGTK